MNKKPSNDSTQELRTERRGFMLGALAALPAAAMLSGCGPVEEGEDLALDEQSEALRPPGLFEQLCQTEQLKRSHRRRLYDEHIKGENHHNIGMVMATFSLFGEMVFNGFPFRDPASIAAAHVSMGMSEFPGALEGLKVVEETLYYTDDEILIEGRLEGKHVADMAGFPATNRFIELPYYAFYRFDRDDKLISERIVMNFAAFVPPPV